MILDMLGDLNWVAIVVATIAWFGFSAIWYSIPPLSAAWQRAAGVDASADGSSLVMIFIPTLVGYFVTAVVIALLVEATGTTGLAGGVALGAVLGVGFGTVGALVTQLYERKGGAYWLVNGVNAVIAYSIVAGILAVWR